MGRVDRPSSPGGSARGEAQPAGVRAALRGRPPATGLASSRAAVAGFALLAGLVAGGFLLAPTAGVAVHAATGGAEAQAAGAAEAAGTAQPQDGRFGFGRPATADDIAAWDIDVMPDGAGLPEGSGTAAAGAPVYAARCAVCHGPSGEGGVADRLVGYDPDSTPPFGPRYEAWRAGRDDVPFSVGNYWPYATTLFDYIRRAMPTDAPGTLAPDEVYGLVAWILAENGIVGRDAVMNAETLPAVEMPARDVFVPQER